MLRTIQSDDIVLNLSGSGQIMFHNQCDQIGRFLKLLATKFLSKEAQIIGNFLGYFEIPHFV